MNPPSSGDRNPFSPRRGRWAQTSIRQGREVSSGDGACAGGLDGQQRRGQDDYWTLKIK